MARTTEAYQLISLPFRATYRGRLQPDPLHVLRRRLAQFQTPAFPAVQGFLQGVRSAVAAHCARTTLLNLQVKSASGYDYLYEPLIYGYLLPS